MISSQRLEAVGGEPRRQVAGDVVEPERGEQHHPAPLGLRPVLLVHDARVGLLAARVQVVRAGADRRGHRRVTELQKRPGAGRDHGCTLERRGQRFLVLRVRDADLLSARHRLERLAAAADEPERDPERARLVADEPSRVSGRAENGEHGRKDTVRRCRSG